MEEKKSYKVYKIVMIIILTAFITFMITTIVGYNYLINGDGKLLLLNTSSNEEDIATKLSKYKTIIDEYYLWNVDEAKLEEGAIKGYIEGLDDPYTEYISKEEMQEYMQDTMGNYVGIGIYMVLDNESGKIRVLAPMKNSPAEEAGLKSGDIILEIDGKSYTADEMSNMSNKIKGEEGTKVKLKILRGTETLEFEIERRNIKVNPVEGKVLENNIGYIQFSSFDETTAEDFKAKYQELESMRNNIFNNRFKK